MDDLIERLKPCPFCGAGAEIREWKRPARYQVRCLNKECVSKSGGVRPDREAAIAAWNNRAELSSLRNDDEVIGSLVEALDAFNDDDLDEERIVAAFFAGLNDKLGRTKEIAARCAARQALAAVKDRP